MPRAFGPHSPTSLRNDADRLLKQARYHRKQFKAIQSLTLRETCDIFRKCMFFRLYWRCCRVQLVEINGDICVRIAVVGVAISGVRNSRALRHICAAKGKAERQSASIRSIKAHAFDGGLVGVLSSEKKSPDAAPLSVHSSPRALIADTTNAIIFAAALITLRTRRTRLFAAGPRSK